MPIIYTISDIHGCTDEFHEILELIDLSDPSNKLILLGDYIDHDYKNYEIYDEIIHLQEKYPDQVIALMGNHDAIFLGILGIEPYASEYLVDKSRIDESVAENIPSRIIEWIKGLPIFHETSLQILVHAGIDEEAGDLWKVGTDTFTALFKFPPTIGKFEKDIIAGHVGTSSLANDPNYHSVYWDGFNHYYIDGTTEESGIIPILGFDTQTNSYFSFFKSTNGDWEKFEINDNNKTEAK